MAKVQKAFGLTAGGLVGAGLAKDLSEIYPDLQVFATAGIGLASSVMFFPDSCEIAVFSLGTGAGTGEDNEHPVSATFFGVGASLGAGKEVAVFVGGYQGPNEFDSFSYSGPFYSIQGSYGLVSGSVFAGKADPARGNGRWMGYNCNTWSRWGLRLRPMELHKGCELGPRWTRHS